MTDEERAIAQWLDKPAPGFGACCCMGAIDNQPLCICMMDFVEEVNGNYYRIHEDRSSKGIFHQAVLLGPVGGPYIKRGGVS